MALVWAGLMDADNQLMKDTVEFFRNGPNKKLSGTVPHALWRPYLNYEISTCEPCYSWNIIHSWQLHDRHRFLEGMYSLYMGALSQNTYISCEHRHGIQGNLFATPLAFYLSRLAVIDDQLAPDELHLLRMCPLAWICATEETVFKDMPTIFGRVSIRFRKTADNQTLNIQLITQFNSNPKIIMLHIPSVSGLKNVMLNGRRYSVDAPIKIAV